MMAPFCLWSVVRDPEKILSLPEMEPAGPSSPESEIFLMISSLSPEQEAGQAHTAAGPAATSTMLRVNVVRQTYVERGWVVNSDLL